MVQRRWPGTKWAVEVKERTVAVAQTATEWEEQLGDHSRWREQRAEGKAEQPSEVQRASPTQSKQELQRAGLRQDRASQITPRAPQTNSLDGNK